MNNISVITEDSCYGCTACSAVCPHDSIKMVSSKKGFYIPQLDKDKCLDCGLCLKSCPAHKKDEAVNKEGSIRKSYALRHKSDKVRFLSSSGGAFTALIDTYINEKNCVVYGAAYINGEICHLRVSPSDIYELRKSKYVQSNLEGIFAHIQSDIKSGLTVIFCGTPCQVDGLLGYIKTRRIDRSRLLTIDFVCHGTLSPRVFSEYLKYCEKKSGSTITNHCFRSKKDGWHRYTAVNTFESGKSDSKSFTSQLFTSLYYTNYSFKEACYSCSYSSVNRVSDITLADFWGIEKQLPELDDNKGVSFVLVNTLKGQEVMNNVKNVDLIEVPVSYTDQAHLDHPVTRPVNNDEFWEYLDQNGFQKMAVKYLKAGKIRRTASFIIRNGMRLIK